MLVLVVVGVLEYLVMFIVIMIGKIRWDNCLNISFYIYIVILC